MRVIGAVCVVFMLLYWFVYWAIVQMGIWWYLGYIAYIALFITFDAKVLTPLVGRFFRDCG